VIATASSGAHREFPPDPWPYDGQLVRIRRVYLFRVLLSRRAALTFRELEWIAEHSQGPLSRRYLGSDLATLVDLGLVSRRAGFGLVPDYSPTLAARRTVKP
jgi:hypothetical protein